MRELNGQELADFMKERQARQVRNLIQEHKIKPKLVILRDSDNPVIRVYVQKKIAYGADILIDVEDKFVATDELAEEIEKANADDGVYGIIVQLPVLTPELTEEITGKIASEKDVDGLGTSGRFDSATATAIDWLLAGYGVELRGKRLALVGYGKLVGRPLEKMWVNSGHEVKVFRSKDNDSLAVELPKYDVIVTATGKPGLITSEMVKKDAVVVDAGTASEKGAVAGDIAEDLRRRKDVLMSAKVGGVGPLTIAALFDGVIRACLAKI